MFSPIPRHARRVPVSFLVACLGGGAACIALLSAACAFFSGQTPCEDDDNCPFPTACIDGLCGAREEVVSEGEGEAGAGGEGEGEGEGVVSAEGEGEAPACTGSRVVNGVGNSTFSTDTSLSNLGSTCTTFGQDLALSGSGLVDLTGADVIIGVDGDMRLSNTSADDTVQLRNLRSVGGSLTIENNSILVELALAGLESVGGDLIVRNHASLSTVRLRSLATVGGDVSLLGNGLLATVELPALTRVDGDMVAVGNGSLCTSTIDDIAARLTTFGGSVSQVGGRSCP